jgi:DNA repair photolyase
VAARYVETRAKTVLNAVRGMGFGWSANPYRGCVHGCHYCFARRYHTYLDLGAGEDFSGVILVKVNAVEVLRAELARPGWRRAMVAVGTATDPYQPIEGRYRLTRGMLEALAEARTPAGVVTKGPMVIRDLDVLAAVRDRAGVSVCVSLTTLDPDLWRRLEPGTAPPRQRLRAVGALAAAGIPVGVLLAPIVPGLTTDRANLEAVVRGAAEHGAGFLGAECSTSSRPCASTSTASSPRTRRSSCRSTGVSTPGRARRPASSEASVPRWPSSASATAWRIARRRRRATGRPRRTRNAADPARSPS